MSAPPPSEVTRQTLVEAAQALFTVDGYAATSLEAIADRARASKGALYHHFSGKQALFEAVLDRVEATAAAAVRAAAEDHDDPWKQAVAGLESCLAEVSRPAYRRIVRQEGPAVLGPDRFREHGERATYAEVHRLVGAVLTDAAGPGPESDAGLDEPSVDTFGRLFFGA